MNNKQCYNESNYGSNCSCVAFAGRTKQLNILKFFKMKQPKSTVWKTSQMLFRTQIFCSLTAYNNYWISVNNIPVRCANLAIKAGCRSNRSRIRALLISEIKKNIWQVRRNRSLKNRSPSLNNLIILLSPGKDASARAPRSRFCVSDVRLIQIISFSVD